jgi:hypothetical protein
VSGAAASAKLRLWVTDASPDGGSVFRVDSGWTETAIKWSNAPAITTGSVASAGATAVGSWVELDVTAAVAGNGPVSFALATTSSNSSYYTSREGANKPQLVVTPAATTATAASIRTAARTSLARSATASAGFLCPLIADLEGRRPARLL